MIPTRHKTKIASTHSYPLGANAISDALIGVPQRELLKINFGFWKGFAKDRVVGAPYRVLSAWYSGSTFTFWSLAGWTIEVDAVPRPLKHVIQGKLIADALPKIREWLISNDHSSEREGGHYLTFYFDELKNEVTAQETSSPQWDTERSARQKPR
jgi:hypothetical protein